MPQRPPIIMEITSDSNLLYLPLVYLLPEDVMAMPHAPQTAPQGTGGRV